MITYARKIEALLVKIIQCLSDGSFRKREGLQPEFCHGLEIRRIIQGLIMDWESWQVMGRF